MILPPLFVRVAWRCGWPAGIWLPVLLLWPLAALLLLPLALLGGVIAALQGWLPRFAQACSSALRMVCELRGLRIDVLDRRSNISIHIY